LKIKILIVAVSFIAGATAGFLWASHAFKKFEIAKEVEVAAQAAMDSVTLAQMRLNETTNAIADLENRMDINISTLAIWDQVASPSAEIRRRRDKWLTSVKVYHQSFPVQNDDTNVVALVNPFLDKIPGRSPASTCKGAISQLDDLRLAALKKETNSATK
jgi:FtsZ-binding cell division protein ZapB